MSLFEWQPGLRAEVDFLQAAIRLGYREVERTHPFVPSTIRRTVTRSREDYRGIDFFITLPRDTQGRVRPTVPLQLTLAWDGEDSFSPSWQETQRKLERKMKADERGFTALFWPVPLLGQEGALQMLRLAAEGDVAALGEFKRLLDKTIEHFMQRRQERILRIGLAMLDAEVHEEKVSWRKLRHLSLVLAQHLRRESEIIKASSNSHKSRTQFARSTLRQCRQHLADYEVQSLEVLVTPATRSLASRIYGLLRLGHPNNKARKRIGRWWFLLPAVLRDEVPWQMWERGFPSHIQLTVLEFALKRFLDNRSRTLSPLPELAQKKERDLPSSITMIHSTEDDKAAWSELTKIVSLLPEGVRRKLNKINRSGKRKEERLAEIRRVLQETVTAVS